MRRGGRGGRGGSIASNRAIKAIVSTAGISRDEKKTNTSKVDLERTNSTYPPLPCEPLPALEAAGTPENTYIVDLKQELQLQFHNSSFYHAKPEARDVRRWSDRYKARGIPEFEPDWDRLPTELNWSKTSQPTRKRKVNEEKLKMKLEKLSRRESNQQKKARAGVDEDATEGGEDAEKVDKEATEDDLAGEDEVDSSPSDEDLLEEENDYVQNYWDNDEEPEGSDDNMDNGD